MIEAKAADKERVFLIVYNQNHLGGEFYVDVNKSDEDIIREFMIGLVREDKIDANKGFPAIEIERRGKSALYASVIAVLVEAYDKAKETGGETNEEEKQRRETETRKMSNGT